jgi:trans-2,3-dihydro-3-hydroxyanthranilate isomerase
VRDYVIADVFTDTPLEGNPVAVFLDGAGLDAGAMQRIARELNLSETVFLLAGDEQADVHARIFTPAVELPFAGHPLLGTAFVVGERTGAQTVRIRCAAGVVPVALARDGERVTFGEMAQPLPTWSAFGQPDALLAALGLATSELPIEVYDNGPRHVFTVAAHAATVAALAPDMAALRTLGELGVSCCAIDGPRIRTRLFGPGLGVAEDPATGSAAGPLAVHLARHGRTPFGEWIEISQGAEIGRPSTLRAVARGTGDRIGAVEVGGAAVIVARGTFALP